MSDAPAFLVITSTPNPEKMDELQSYLHQAMPVLMSGGGKPVGRYKVTEQVAGQDGPKTVAILEYPSAQAIRDVISGDDFNALNALRAEVFLRLDLMISEAM
jgi:uncharacterized protein (DUF1330 family)